LKNFTQQLKWQKIGYVVMGINVTKVMNVRLFIQNKGIFHHPIQNLNQNANLAKSAEIFPNVPLIIHRRP
jgi:hypothetical protein